MQVQLENIISVNQVKEKLDSIIGGMGKDDLYVLTHGDKPAAVLVSIDHYKDMVGKNGGGAPKKNDWGDAPAKPSNLPPLPPLPPKPMDTPKPADLPPLPPLPPLTPKPAEPMKSNDLPPLPPLPPKPMDTPKPADLPPLPPLTPKPTSDGPLVTEKEADKAASSDIYKPLNSSSLPPLPPLPPKPSAPSTPPPLPPKPMDAPKPTSPFSNLANDDLDTPPSNTPATPKPTVDEDEDELDDEIL